MATQIPQPITHLFKEINEGKYKTTKHYELLEMLNGRTLLSNFLNISKNQNCALSMPEYWIKIRQGKKWSKCLTGLFITSKTNLYKGDINRKRDLVVFKFSDDTSTLLVYYFQNNYTTDLSKVLPFINN
ncbi:hypothetical protein [Aureibaculum luteum]|uniref:hypothetical protein n=1 Tax=Aureibaculum luteum TaxID=1548456 RepID=UPI0013004CD6|nr:hypothetical protein [Aureibaculum luteum]